MKTKNRCMERGYTAADDVLSAEGLSANDSHQQARRHTAYYSVLQRHTASHTVP